MDTSTKTGNDDPSLNVRDVVDKTVKHMNDLIERDRTHYDKLLTVYRAHDTELRALAVVKTDAIIAAEGRRVNELSTLRADYDAKASTLLAQQVEKSALVLSGQLDKSAETLRMLVASTATTTQNSFAQIIDRLSELEKSKFVGVGKEQIQDPMMTGLLLEIKGMREDQKFTKGGGEGMKNLWAIIVGGVGLIIGAIGFFVK